MFVERLAVGQIRQGVGHGVAAHLFEVLAQTGDLAGRSVEPLLQRLVLALDLAGGRGQSGDDGLQSGPVADGLNAGGGLVEGLAVGGL
jgi:hypothetical protein